MKRLAPALFLFLNLMPTYSQAQYWLWGSVQGSQLAETSAATCVDYAGNVYAAGTFASPSLTLGANTYTNQGYTDIYLAKYDSVGTFLWAKTFGGLGSDSVFAIKTDAQNNLIFVGTTTKNGDTDGFFTKLDALGNQIFSQNIAGSNLQTVQHLAIDRLNNIILSGEFNSPTLTLDGTNIPNNGNTDAYLAKYSATGSLLLYKHFGGLGYETAPAICTDFQNNIYAAGAFSTTNLSIANQVFNCNGATDFFVAKIASAGNFDWIKTLGSTGYDAVTAIATDRLGGVYLAGQFTSSQLNFGNNLVLNNASNTSDVFVLKCATNDGQAQWVRHNFGTQNDYATALSVSPSNDIWVSGSFYSPFLNLNNGGVTLVNFGLGDAYLLRYNTSGVLQVGQAINSTGYDAAKDLAATHQNSVYVAGSFADNIIGFGTFVLNGVGGNDGFLAKYGYTLAPIADFTMSDTTICAESCISLTNFSRNSPTSYKWRFTGANQDSSTQTSPQNICFDTPGNYTVGLTAINAYGKNTLTAQVFVKPNPTASISPANNVEICSGKTTTLTALPPNLRYAWSNGSAASSIEVGTQNFYTVKTISAFGCVSPSSLPVQVNILNLEPTITQNCYELTASEALSYQWQLNNFDVAGATAKSHQVLPSSFGSYRVRTTTADGCIGISQPITVGEINHKNLVKIMPNPSLSGIFELEYTQKITGNTRILVVNALGQVVRTFDFLPNQKKVVDLQNQAMGVYILQGTIADCGAFNYKILVGKP